MKISPLQLRLPWPVTIPYISNGREWMRATVPGTIWNENFSRKAGSRDLFRALVPVAAYGNGLLYSTIALDEFGNMVEKVDGWRPNNGVHATAPAAKVNNSEARGA